MSTSGVAYTQKTLQDLSGTGPLSAVALSRPHRPKQ